MNKWKRGVCEMIRTAKSKYCEKNVCQFHAVHHKSHMDRSYQNSIRRRSMTDRIRKSVVRGRRCEHSSDKYTNVCNQGIKLLVLCSLQKSERVLCLLEEWYEGFPGGGGGIDLLGVWRRGSHAVHMQ